MFLDPLENAYRFCSEDSALDPQEIKAKARRRERCPEKKDEKFKSGFYPI